MKEFLKDFCREIVPTCCIAAELGIAVWLTATGDYVCAVWAFALSLMLIIVWLYDMSYESLQHYTNELEKRYYRLLLVFCEICEQHKEPQPEFTEDVFCEACGKRISHGTFCVGCDPNSEWNRR